MSNVSALILASGTSRRMGRAKQLLDLHGVPLVERVIRSVLPFDFMDIVTVIGYRAQSIKAAVDISDERFRWVMNENYQGGQSTSLRIGIDSCSSESVMIFLGDQPFISDETTRGILQYGFEKQSALTGPSVVRPSFKETPGHPVFLSKIRYMDLSKMNGDEGARHIVRRLKHRFTVPVEDWGVTFDIDTPQAYERAKRIAKYYYPTDAL